MNRYTVAFGLAMIVAGSAVAQTATYRWFPTGTDVRIGGGGNSIPLSSKSATYQQIHDARDLRRQGAVLALKGLALRPAGSRSFPGRSIECQLRLNTTKVDPLKASATFASNLGAAPALAVGSTNAQGTPVFQKISWPTTVPPGRINPPAVLMPFAKPYSYSAAKGNLVWELRYKNASTTSNAYLDATAFTNASNLGQALFSGRSCSHNGRASSARFLVTQRAGSVLRDLNVTLSSAPSGSKALLAIGAVKQNANLGWCTTLQVNPFLIVPGAAASNGSWNTRVPLNALVGLPPIQVHAQFAYDDSSQASGFGLTNLASYLLPKHTGAHGMTRIWKVAQTAVNGEEKATTGTVGLAFGLVTGFQR